MPFPQRSRSGLRACTPLLAGLILCAGAALADKKYGPGVTDTEIKIGQTAPYSGAMSAWGTIGRAQAAYFAKINAEGGIAGRKIKFISLDDAYNPARTVEQTRKLVEREKVLLIFNPVGSPTNAAVQKYLNNKKVPQLFVGAGDARFGDPKKYPWSMGFHQTNYTEGKLYAAYILQHHPRGRIAAFYINDEFGKELLKGLRDGLGSRAGEMLAATASYELNDPTVDSQIIALHASGADIFVNFALQKAAAQAIRKIYDIGWRPTHFLNYAATSVSEVLLPAGANKSLGILSIDNQKDPTDAHWKDDPALKDWLAWMRQYYPQGNADDSTNVYAYTLAQLLVHTLKRCGDDLTRENVMRQAANIKDLELPMLLPGIKINTGPTDFYPIEQVRLLRFNGTRLEIFGDVIGR
jgi:ABC-type branched-subunit amino acid transport system substrate-binding protein